MSGHFNIVCRECGTRIGGCRCPSAHKTVKLGVCKDCEVRLDNAVQDDEDQVLGDNIILGSE